MSRAVQEQIHEIRSEKVTVVTILESNFRFELRQALVGLSALPVYLNDGVCDYQHPLMSQLSAEAGGIRRFNQLNQEHASRHDWVVVADIKDCFASFNLPRVAQWMVSSYGVTGQKVSSLLRRLNAEGVDTLPPDYPEFRYIGNLLLDQIDVSIIRPFVRFADDYRVYCRSEDEADFTLKRLRLRAMTLDLALNAKKTWCQQTNMSTPPFPLLSARPIVRRHLARLSTSHPEWSERA